MIDQSIFRSLGFSWRHWSTVKAAQDKPRALMRAKKVLSSLVFDMAALEGNTFTYYWFLSDTKFMNAIFSTKFWKEKGLVSLTDTYNKARQELQTAVYGSVRTVV